jgi:hypothetical protein
MHLSTLKFASTKSASKYYFILFLHEIMLCKLVHDDVFHWDQMLKPQKLNLEISELYMLQLIVLGIEYM